LSVTYPPRTQTLPSPHCHPAPPRLSVFDISSSHQVTEAWRVLAGGADGLTKEQIRSGLPAELVEYALTNMPLKPGVWFVADYFRRAALLLIQR
jgi:hypothetical protein